MKIITLTFLFFSVLFSVGAQNRKTYLFNLNDFAHKEIEITFQKSKDLISLPFKTIHVFDKRNDTSVLGFGVPGELSAKKTSYLTLKNGTAIATQSFIKNAVIFDDTSGYELVMIIRKLWLSREIELHTINDNDQNDKEPFASGILTRFEFYIKKEQQFSILYRFDSTFISTKKKPDETELIETALLESIKKIKKMHVEQKAKTGPKLNWEQIDSFSIQFHSLPVFYTVQLQKGIFLSYNEFKNNQPSIKNYEIRKGQMGDLLIAKDKLGVEYPLRKIWGFSDGQTIFIKSADNFFPIYFFNNTVYTRAAKFAKRSSGENAKFLSYILLPMPIADGLDRSGAFEHYGITLQYYQLDIETGKLY